MLFNWESCLCRFNVFIKKSFNLTSAAQRKQKKKENHSFHTMKPPFPNCISCFTSGADLLCPFNRKPALPWHLSCSRSLLPVIGNNWKNLWAGTLLTHLQTFAGDTCSCFQSQGEPRHAKVFLCLISTLWSCSPVTVPLTLAAISSPSSHHLLFFAVICYLIHATAPLFSHCYY